MKRSSPRIFLQISLMLSIVYIAILIFQVPMNRSQQAEQSTLGANITPTSTFTPTPTPSTCSGWGGTCATTCDQTTQTNQGALDCTSDSSGNTQVCCIAINSTTSTSSAMLTPTPDECAHVDLSIDPKNCGINAHGIGLFCGGNCGVVGDANTLYQCNTKTKTKIALLACSSNKCITCPGAPHADECGSDTSVCGPQAPDTPISTPSATTTTTTPTATTADLSLNTFSASTAATKSLYGTVMIENITPTAQKERYLASRVLGVQVYKASGVFTYDAKSGYFVNKNFSLGLLPAGDYHLIVHVDNYLDRRLRQYNGSDIFSLPSGIIQPSVIPLVPGDIAPSPYGDNYIDIQDYNQLISCLQDTNFCSQKKKIADLNNDGAITTQDLQVLMDHFGELGEGFAIPGFTCVSDPACGTENTSIKFCALKCTKVSNVQ